MSKQKKWIAALVILVVIIAVLAGVYKAFGPKTSEGTKHCSVEVVAADGTSTSYETASDAEYLKDIMDTLSKTGTFSYEGEESDYGLYITAINGETADYSTDGAYWAIYVNGEYGQYGADQQPVADGDSFKFVYETSK